MNHCVRTYFVIFIFSFSVSMDALFEGKTALITNTLSRMRHNYFINFNKVNTCVNARARYYVGSK